MVPNIIKATEPICKPPPKLIRASNKTGNKAVAGTEAAIWTSGCKNCAMRGLRPIATPTGTVQRRERIKAVMTLRAVKIAPLIIIFHSAKSTIFNSNVPSQIPQRIIIVQPLKNSQFNQRVIVKVPDTC